MFLSHKPDAKEVRVNAMLLRRIVKLVIIFTTAGVILLPIGILFLSPMTHPTSFGVVVIATFAFSFAIALQNDISLLSSLLGMCAYVAVLVTFLAQFSAQPPESPIETSE